MTNVDMVRSSAAEDTSHGSRASIRRGHRSDAAGVDHGLIERVDHDQFIRAFLRPHPRRLGTSVAYTNAPDQTPTRAARGPSGPTTSAPSRARPAAPGHRHRRYRAERRLRTTRAPDGSRCPTWVRG